MATIRDVYLNAQTGEIFDSFTSKTNLDLWPFFQGDNGLFWRVHNIVPTPGAEVNAEAPFSYSPVAGLSLQMALGDLNQLSTGGSGSLVDPSTEATSGVLVVGADYLISDYNAGDNFTNVGAGSNETGEIFTASGTTPTTWSNGSTLIQVVSGIEWNESAANLQSAIQAAFSNWPNATVTGTGPWTIDRVDNGAVELLEGIGTLLTPDSFVKVEPIREGTDGYSARVRVSFVQRPAVYVNTSTYFDAPTVNLVEKREGGAGANAIWRLTFGSTVYGGVYELSSAKLGAANDEERATLPIPFGATAEEIQDLINDAGSFGEGNEVTVSVINDYTIDITFTGDNVTLKDIDDLTVDDDQILGMEGWLAQFDLNNSGAANLLNGAASVTTTFEIQITDADGDVTTPYQNTGATLRAELISASTTGANEYPGFATQAMFDKITDRVEVTFSSAGTTEVTIQKYTKIYTVDLNVGAGTYTRNIDLSSVAADRKSGDKVEVILRVDAGFTASGLINIRNDTGSTVLWPESGVDAAFTRNLWFTWNGDTWKSDQ